ncbi:MAG: hypothetical protein V7707_05205 [Motiliproteus sp.]
MITKILVTAAVIFCCYLYIRYKRNKATTQGYQSARTVSSAPVVGGRSAISSLKGSPVRMLALGLCVSSVLASAIYLGSSWWDDRTLLQVRVVNTHSGTVTDYQAYKGDVQGRAFITIFGQRVSIADTERMEINEATPR